MPLNVIEKATLDRKISRVTEVLQEVEAFFAGKQIQTARIGDATIGTANIADLAVTNAKIADLAITNAKIGSVDAGDFTAGTISADRIGAASISVAKLDIEELSSISTNVGTITAGTITGNTVTGGTVRSASSGSRIEMSASPNAIRFYDGSTQKNRIDSDGMALNMPAYILDSSNTYKCSMFLNNSALGANWYIQAGNCDSFDIIQGTSGGDINFVAANGNIQVETPNGETRINGSAKTAIVPTSQGYNALYCLESPEVWLFDFAKDIDSIDKIFLENTEGEKNILKTDQGELLVFRRRKGFGNTRFEQKTLKQFKENNRFWGNYGLK